MPKTAQPLRTITGNEAGTFALTLKELAAHISESESSLRSVSRADMARAFRVSKTQITRIMKNKSWKQ